MARPKCRARRESAGFINARVGLWLRLQHLAHVCYLRAVESDPATYGLRARPSDRLTAPALEALPCDQHLKRSKPVRYQRRSA